MNYELSSILSMSRMKFRMPLHERDVSVVVCSFLSLGFGLDVSFFDDMSTILDDFFCSPA